MAKIRIPKKVLEAVECVRQGGSSNMLDRPAIMKLAEWFDFPETAQWIDEHRKEYAEGIFMGFEAEGGE